MKRLEKVCLALTAFGAFNWALLGMFGVDALTAALGPVRTVGGDMLRIVVAMGAAGSLLLLARSRT